VIEHIKDDRGALKNLFSHVRPGGYLIVTVPAHSFLFGKRDRAWGHFRRYNRKNLKQILSTLGGDIAYLGYWNFLGFFPYLLFERILQRPIREKFRYKNSLISRLIRAFVITELRTEEYLGGAPLGLTLVAILKKN
jgi:SAM-dependent methyltransferase